MEISTQWESALQKKLEANKIPYQIANLKLKQTAINWGGFKLAKGGKLPCTKVNEDNYSVLDKPAGIQIGLTHWTEGDKSQPYDTAIVGETSQLQSEIRVFLVMDATLNKGINDYLKGILPDQTSSTSFGTMVVLITIILAILMFAWKYFSENQ